MGKKKGKKDYDQKEETKKKGKDQKSKKQKKDKNDKKDNKKDGKDKNDKSKSKKKNGTNTNKKDKKSDKKEEKPKTAKKNTKKKKEDDNTTKSKKNAKGKGKGNKTPTPSLKKTKSNGKDIKLKQWMDQNNVYDKQLHAALVSNDIDSSQKIKKMNQAKFDSIVRKYRVDRFAKTKNQKARNKIDKTLLSFEKAWRKTKKGTKTKKQKK